MIKVKVINHVTGIIYEPSYETLEQAQAEIARHTQEKNWGIPEHTIQVETSPYIPAEYDEEGNEISPEVEAVYEDEIVPSEFTIEIEDITEQVEQERINQNARAYLTSTDWQILRHIRQQALGEALSLSEEAYLELEQLRSDAAASIVN
jgi:hypothetical protein